MGAKRWRLNNFVVGGLPYYSVYCHAALGLTGFVVSSIVDPCISAILPPPSMFPVRISGP